MVLDNYLFQKINKYSLIYHVKPEMPHEIGDQLLLFVGLFFSLSRWIRKKETQLGEVGRNMRNIGWTRNEK